ncbi:MAG: flagellar motor switch protein FliG, partial [Treponema sp.]|nr:flagellar motor switch protein FliG [Treponema sp.]
MKKVESHAEKTAGMAKVSGGFIKGTRPPADSKCRRLAKFLILIGGDEAARIFAELDAGQVEAVSREIASIRGITAEEGEKVLDEFRLLFSRSWGSYGSSRGGIETARRLLYAAFGPEKGEEFAGRAAPSPRENPFGFLDDFSPEQVSLLLREEAPAAAALILSRIPSKLSAAVLAQIPSERKLDIIRRIARQGQVSLEVLERAAAALKEKARSMGGAGGVRIDGMKTLAAILKTGDYSFSGRILGELEEENPELGRDIKERLYTLDDVINTAGRPLEEKLGTMTEREIALLLEGASSLFAEKVYSCVSRRRRALIEEERENRGAAPKKEMEKAVRD